MAASCRECFMTKYINKECGTRQGPANSMYERKKLMNGDHLLVRIVLLTHTQYIIALCQM